MAPGGDYTGASDASCLFWPLDPFGYKPSRHRERKRSRRPIRPLPCERMGAAAAGEAVCR